MTEVEFMERLKTSGYDCYVDGVVMVRVDPEQVDQLRRLVKESGWNRSWGFVASGKIPVQREDAAKTQRKASRSAKAEPAAAAATPKPQKKRTGKKKEQRSEARHCAETIGRALAAGLEAGLRGEEEIPGQMNIYDFLKR